VKRFASLLLGVLLVAAMVFLTMTTSQGHRSRPGRGCAVAHRNCSDDGQTRGDTPGRHHEALTAAITRVTTSSDGGRNLPVAFVTGALRHWPAAAAAGVSIAFTRQLGPPHLHSCPLLI
jgi:hypothetical protein